MKLTNNLTNGWNWMLKFEILKPNWCQKIFPDQTEVNFKMFKLKRIFTHSFKFIRGTQIKNKKEFLKGMILHKISKSMQLRRLENKKGKVSVTKKFRVPLLLSVLS